MDDSRRMDAGELLADARWIRALAGRLTRDDDAADDVAQDALARALAHRPAGAARPWLARVAANLVRERARKDGHRRDRERDDARDEALPATDDLVVRAEAQRALVDLVLALPEEQRTPLLLRYFEGVEPARIAERLGIPPGTVRSRLARGIDALRERLDRRYGRAAWCALLAPPRSESVPSPTPVNAGPAGALAMTPVKLALAAAALVAALPFAARLLSEPEGGGGDGTQVASSAPSASLPSAPGAQEAADVERGGRTPVVAEDASVSARAALARLSGTLVDGDGAPLPDYLLHFETGGEAHLATTDAAGAFDAGAVPTGDVVVRFVDHPDCSEVLLDERDDRPPHVRTVRHDGEPLALTVAVPPVLRLLVDAQDGAPQPVHAVLTSARGERVEAPIRRDAEGRPWVRFREALGRGDDAVWTLLRALDASGEWSSGYIGPYFEIGDPPALPEELAVFMRRDAVLAGRVTTEDGAPLAGVDVVLTETEGTRGMRDLFGPQGLRAETAEDGSYALRWVPRGSWRLSVELAGGLYFVEDVRLEPGRAEREVVVPAPDQLASVAGAVTSRTGTLRAPVTVTLRADDGRRFPERRFELVWEGPDDALVAPFEVGALEEGSYVVRAFVSALLELEPREHRFVVGSEEAPVPTFVVEDDVPLCRLAPHVRDAATGEPLDAFLHVELADPADAVAGRSGIGVQLPAGEPTSLAVPLGRAFTWMVWAPGRRPTHGDERDFAAAEELTVALEPGWGTLVVARDAEGEPCRAEVWFDGERMGTTDAAGRLVVSLAKKPETGRVAGAAGEARLGAGASQPIRDSSRLHVSLTSSPSMRVATPEEPR